MRTVTLRAGRAKPLWLGHPWVFADSVASLEDGPPEDDWVQVLDADGRRIGYGFLSPGSALCVRIVTREDAPPPPDDLLRERLQHACALRRRLFPDAQRTNAYRLVHSEGDDLPGLVVDRFGDDVLVAQFGIGATHRRRALLARTLLELTGCRTLVARAAGYEEAEEIRPDEAPFLVGPVPPDVVAIREEGLDLEAAPLVGQKTGHYADQRENRLLVGRMAEGLEVLDLYAGTGGFALQCPVHGARHVTAVESSPRCAEAARRNARRNGVGERVVVEQEDVRAVLEGMRAAKRQVDLVIADPPNFFPRSGPAPRGMKAHRELNVRAMSRVRPRGFLATFSCSARLDPPAFLAMLGSASRECRRGFRVLRELGAGPDHPVSGSLSSGRYLTGFLLQID